MKAYLQPDSCAAAMYIVLPALCYLLFVFCGQSIQVLLILQLYLLHLRQALCICCFSHAMEVTQAGVELVLRLLYPCSVKALMLRCLQQQCDVGSKEQLLLMLHSIPCSYTAMADSAVVLSTSSS
jgi:hypothetical protein